MTTSDKEWQRVIANGDVWLWMTGSGTKNQNEWEQIQESEFKFQNEPKGQFGSWRILFSFYAICNYYIFNKIDNLWIIDDTYFQYNISCLYHASNSLFFSLLVVKCEALFFENIT